MTAGAAELFERALERHAARDLAASIALTRDALVVDPDHVRSLEHLATLLITRKQAYDEGVELIERATLLQPEDAGIWYAAGWCLEFAAHELMRRGDAAARAKAPDLYLRAADHFRRCLALNPGGKLVGDAEDLLDHVENELRNL